MAKRIPFGRWWKRYAQRTVRARRRCAITEPTAEQKILLRQLGISLPDHLQFNRECSVDSAIS